MLSKLRSSACLSDGEKALARTAPLINVVVEHVRKLVFNKPGGELYWAVKNRPAGPAWLSPEAAIAVDRGVRIVYGAAREHTIPWAKITPEDWLLVGGADSHADNVELARITNAMAAWLGYPNRFAYAEACHGNPAEVIERLKAAE